jgi:phosphate transport system substrate-binding protein
MGVQPLEETPTRGNISISVDESFQLLFDAQIFTFQSLYAHAKIAPRYKPEAEVISDFMNDSVRTIVVTRELTKEENEYLANQSIIARTVNIAHDAIALIINNDNPDSLILESQFNDMLTGKITSWDQVSSKSGKQKIDIVFDNNKSGNVRYFRERFSIKDKFPPNCYAVNSNKEVVEHVKKNRNAIGIISVNWISDFQDSTSQKFLESVRIVDVGTSIGDACKPYQGYMADGSYPFCRDVFMIKRETFTGLGSGFITFVAGEKGQRIVLRSGLVPATMPVRLVEIKRD